jgi:hypothetical protein
MDKLFYDFENWFNSKIIIWKKQGVIVDKYGEATHAHQFHIELHSEQGFGHIALYESNQIYWVDFEAATLNGGHYFQTNINYENSISIEDISCEFIDFMCK